MALDLPICQTLFSPNPRWFLAVQTREPVKGAERVHLDP
jgi:hypothetical protein